MVSKNQPVDLEALARACEPPAARFMWGALDARAWAARWDALCAMLVKPEWERSADQWLGLAEAALEAWPDEVRRWPHAWLRRKVAPRATRLVRALHLGEQAAATHEALFNQLAALDAQTRPPLVRVLIAQPITTKKPSPTIDARQAAILMDLLAATPPKQLFIIGADSEPLWEALAASPALSTVRALCATLYKNPLIPRGRYEALLEATLASEHAGALDELVLYVHGQGQLPSGVASLITERHAARLTALSPSILRDDATRDMFADTPWPALRKLVLRDAMRVEQLDRWLRHAPALDHLDVWGKLTGHLPAGAAQPRLRELSLGHMELAVEVEALLRSARCEALERLSLYRVPLTAGALEALGAMPLERLQLIPAQGDAPWRLWRGLRMAQVTGLQLECPAAADLLAIDLPALTHLSVTLEVLADADLDAIERAPWFAQLKHLAIVAWQATPKQRERLGALNLEASAR